jgi:putative hydrolase of the HAD superfamily
METAQKFRSSDLVTHFDVTVFSAEIGLSKPHPQAFKIFCERLMILPSEMVFIDDTEKSLEAAKSVGFHPLLFIDFESLIQSLRLIGVKI